MSALAEMEVRRAPAAVSTWNEAARTVDVVWAAGADVKRYSWAEGGYFIERLRMTPEAVDLSRLNAGASLLDAHQAYSMNDRVGVVIAGSARIVAGQGVATVQLLNNDGGEALADACRSGAGFLVSVGYSTSEYERDDGDGTSLPIITSTRWLPLEISAVPIPADPAAGTRSHNERQHMSLITTTTAPSAPAASADALAERERITMLRTIAARGAKVVTPETLTRAIERGVTVEAFRAEVWDRLAERDEATITFPYADRSGSGLDGNGSSDRTLADLTAFLSGKGTKAPITIARDHLATSGMRGAGSMSDREIGAALIGGKSIWNRGGLHTSADFGFLVAQATSAALLDRFQERPIPLERFSHPRDLPDFRQGRFYRPGGAPDLLKVGEAGEIKAGTMRDESNGFAVDTYARIFKMSFQAGVNDGLGALLDFTSTFAESGTRAKGDLFFAVLAGNGPKLDDGLALYHANHENVAAVGTALSIESIADAVLALRSQRGVGGEGSAGVEPAAIVVGPALELRARQLVAQITAARSEDVNPYRLDVVVENRFGREFKGWYVVGGADRPPFVHGSLEGHGPGPQVDTREGWEVLGVEYRCILHFGVGVYDYRAIYYNPGA